MSEYKKEELAQLFNEWRNDNIITTAFFKYIDEEIISFNQRLLSLRNHPCSADNKLISLGALSALIEYLILLKELSYDDFYFYNKEKKT